MAIVVFGNGEGGFDIRYGQMFRRTMPAQFACEFTRNNPNEAQQKLLTPQNQRVIREVIQLPGPISSVIVTPGNLSVVVGFNPWEEVVSGVIKSVRRHVFDDSNVVVEVDGRCTSGVALLLAPVTRF